MRTKVKVLISLISAFFILLLGVGVGTVYVSPLGILGIIGHKLFGMAVMDGISATEISIIWSLRLPRALLAFIVGGALSVSGAVMQSVLRNPLASSYTLGISSGASLGAGIVILFGFTLPVVSLFTLPIMGFLCGLATIFLVMGLSTRLGKTLENNTIILTGMVISLFVNAIVTLISALAREQMQRLIYWQMGSFSLKDWSTVLILLPVLLIGVALITHYHRELDMMTFGEDQAITMGIPLKKIKWILLITGAALTGSAISFVGVIGFIDLIAPHIVRKIFGSSHRLVIPMSAIIGGAFMVICDLVARTIVSPQELPVGAITALIGAPFFAYIYFGKKRK